MFSCCRNNRFVETWVRSSVAHQIDSRLRCELATSVAVETDYENGFRGSLGSRWSVLPAFGPARCLWLIDISLKKCLSTHRVAGNCPVALTQSFRFPIAFPYLTVHSVECAYVCMYVYLNLFMYIIVDVCRGKARRFATPWSFFFF